MANGLSRSFRVKIRILFLSILLIFPLQLLFIYQFGEPYPALMMPAFGGSGGAEADGSFSATHNTIVIHFTDGQTEQTTRRTLLEETPGSHHATIMRNMFRPHEERQAPPDDLWGSSEAEQFVKTHVIPGYVLRQQRGAFELEAHADTKQWLYQRVRELYPGRTPSSVEFIRHTDTLMYSRNNLRQTDQDSSSFRIEFS